MLILDEATSNLDTESERLIEDALAQASGGPDDAHHRPPAEHRAAGGPAGGAGSGAGSWRKGPTPSCWSWAGCTPGCTSDSSGMILRGLLPRSKTEPTYTREAAPLSGGLFLSLCSGLTND